MLFPFEALEINFNVLVDVWLECLELLQDVEGRVSYSWVGGRAFSLTREKL